MTVYMLSVVHLYPEVDGCGFIKGVYSTKELAEKVARELAPIYAEEMGTDIHGNPAFRLVIEEFLVE